MNPLDRIEDDCRILADIYRNACVARARAEGRLAIRPDDPLAHSDRFDSGMAEATAWGRFRDRTGDLMEAAGRFRAAQVREAAIRTSTAAGLAALKAILREAADAA